MQYFFILGRNPKLSAAEIFSYFEKQGISIVFYFLRSNGLLIKTGKKIDAQKTIKELGGSIAIGEILFRGNIEDVVNDINSREIYFGADIKFVYSLISLVDEKTDDILEAVKENFAKEKLKARFKSIIKIKTENEKYFKIPPISSKDINYFIFKQGKQLVFGIIKAVHEPKEAEKRDIKKPVRREELAISPRLAKILINLSQVKSRENLLDPFCGIGAVLMEALLQNINVIGVDIDKKAVESAKRNISWLHKNYKFNARFKVINQDSRKVQLKAEKMDSIATEPSLGILLKKIPSKKYALAMIKRYEDLITAVLNNIKKYLKQGGKTAFTAPFIKTSQGKASCNIKKICNDTGLRLYNLRIKGFGFPIREFREDMIVGREFYVLADI